MIGPNPNSLGTIANDFFAHGAVIHGGAFILVPTQEICLGAGFKTEHTMSAGFDLERSLGAGVGSVSLNAGFETEFDMIGSIPECDD